jgi:PAS domain S-box-containing protein
MNDDLELLRQRSRVGLWLALASNLLFVLADVRLKPPQMESLLLVKLAAIVAILAGMVALGRCRTRRAVTILSLCVLTIVVMASSVSGILIGDHVSTPILCLAVALLAATLLPWGGRAQLAASGITAAAVLLNLFGVTGGLGVAFGYPGVAGLFVFAASVYVAYVFERYRVAIGRQQDERLRAEHALRASEAELRRVFESLEDVFFRVDLSGRLLKVSPSVETLGYRPDQLIGADMGLLYLDTAERGRMLDELMRAGSLRDYDVQLVRAGGEPLWASIAAHLVHDADGRLIGVEGILRDVSARKAAEGEIRELNESAQRRARELEVANRELESFSYSVSHDLRGPLQGIDSFSAMLMEDYGERLDDRAKGYVLRVRAAAQRMGQLIDDLLALSRVTRAELRRELVNLSAIAGAIAEDLKLRDGRRQVTFRIEENITVAGDAVLLRIVLENLFDNAWKFTAGRESARIEFGCVEIDGERACYVRDDGVGFDMAYAGKLFGPFERLHSAHEFAGTGIGLATVERIVRRHHGRVWAHGEVGVGATFYFTVGKVPRSDAEDRRERAARQASAR